VAALLGLLVVLMVISWLGLAGNLWAAALGRPFLEGVPLLLGAALVAVAALLAKVWEDAWWPFLCGSVVAALLVKAVATLWVVRRLRRARLVENWELRWALLGWGVLLALVLSMVLWLLPGEPLAVGVAVLLLPLARTLAAPLALASNRTR
jgi:hypothetical protein